MTQKVDIILLDYMIWKCKHCTTVNANISDSCVVCGIVSSHKGHSDEDLQDIYLETICYYVTSEVRRCGEIVNQMTSVKG